MHTVPISKETALQLTAPPQISETEFVDRNLWLYELCRFLTQKANVVSIFLMNDNPPCSSQTCPEMRASEWQYLCAVHEPPKSCCAIDYCNHTLDWAANVLTSPKHFPSRLALGGEAGNVNQSMRQLTNIFRRVYRIFAHAWFQHRDAFWSVEATYGLYVLFKVVCDEYHLIPEDSYTIPPEAEGTRQESDDQNELSITEPERVQILRKDDDSTTFSESTTSADGSDTPVTTTITTGATARRHKHTPSTGSHVATIAEGQEEDDDTTNNTALPELIPPNFGAIITGTEIPASPPQKKDRSPERRLPRLDIGATVPKYEPRAPADPTPTGTESDIDPLSGTLPTAIQTNKGESVTVQTPTTQISHEDEEQQVTSPSGGSIRTGGPDVLQAILGHIDDLDDEDEAMSPGMWDDTSPLRRRASEATEVRIEVEEKTNDDEDEPEEKAATGVEKMEENEHE